MDTAPASPSPSSHRNVLIAGGVVLFHAAALWALQTGLLRRAAEVIVPVEILAEILTPPAPVERPPEVKPPPPAPKPVAKQKIAPPPAPRPVAMPSLPPAPNAPTGVIEPQPAAPPIAAPVAAMPAPAPVAAPAPAKVELPSTDADYLQNPKPAYPPMSKRLGEQGRILVRVLIGVDGTAKEAQLKQSSGFDRLDQAALDTVRKWRYVPGKRGGVPEAMWFTVPINFVLE
jgi:protein TonB